MPQQLSLKILGEQDQGVIDEFRFFEGEERTFKAQVYDTEDDQKYQIPASSVLTLTLAGTPDDIEIENANITIDSTDRSIFSTTLAETQTDATGIISGQVTLEIVDSGDVTRIAIKEHALKKVVGA